MQLLLEFPKLSDSFFKMIRSGFNNPDEIEFNENFNEILKNFP